MNCTKKNFCTTELLTWVESVAGDLGSLQSLGQLVVKENVAQFAVTVDLEDTYEWCSQPQSFVGG